MLLITLLNLMIDDKSLVFKNVWRDNGYFGEARIVVEIELRQFSPDVCPEYGVVQAQSAKRKVVFFALTPSPLPPMSGIW